MDFNIILFEGTDSVKFGMTHEEIQAILGVQPELFKKNEFDLHMTENYRNICHVFYDTSGCVAFEFYAPSQVFFNGVQLMGEQRIAVEPLFHNLKGYESDANTDDGLMGLSVYNRDFSLYVLDGHVESVYICRKGYFAEQFEYYKKKYAEKFNK